MCQLPVFETGAHRTELLYKIIHIQNAPKSRLGLDARKPGAEQHAHPRTLISAFVIRFLESSISHLTSSENAFFRC